MKLSESEKTYTNHKPEQDNIVPVESMRCMGKSLLTVLLIIIMISGLAFVTLHFGKGQSGTSGDWIMLTQTQLTVVRELVMQCSHLLCFGIILREASLFVSGCF